MARRHESISSTAPVSSERTRPKQSLPIIALIGAAAVIGIIATIGLRGSSSQTPQPATWAPVAIEATAPPTSVPTITPVPATPIPVCPSIEPYVAIIQGLEQAGEWGKAADEAEDALSLPSLCDPDRKTLIRYAVSDGLKDLYAQPFKPLDRHQQQAMIDRYLSFKQRAHDAGVPIDTPLQVASRAFPSSQFHLSRVALEEALKDRSFKPETNRDITKNYVSTLFGLGKWYTSNPAQMEIYQEGLAWLVASDQVAVKYQTGQSEAAALLKELGYPDKGKWPQAASTPLLDTQ
jgi:hypothetical protein